MHRNRAIKFLQRNSPTILMIFAAVGTVGTAVLAADGHVKAQKVLQEYKDSKTDTPTKLEVIKIMAPKYAPAVVMGAATIGCMLGSNHLNRRQQASLASAYALLNQTYHQYQNTVKDICGPEAHEAVTKKMLEGEIEVANPDLCLYSVDFMGSSCLDFDENVDRSELKTFFLDVPPAGRYFESTKDKVIQAEYHLNRNFIMYGEATLDELITFFGICPTDIDRIIGWSVYDGECWIDFDHDKVVLDDGMEIYRINPVFTPCREALEMQY